MRTSIALLITAAALNPAIARAAEAGGEAAGDAEGAGSPTITVTGARATSQAGTKTDTPLIETPQPITIVDAETFRAQGAISISDTLRYVAGVTSNPFGSDTRVDSNKVRGLDALQFRDGMRDLYSYYASIRADPYNFSRIELVRGPASVLFGQASLGGIVNMVSKSPDLTGVHGEIEAVYGSFDRKELLADVNLPLAEGVAARLVGRLRDSGTQVDHVPDDRVMIAPSLMLQPTEATDITLIGLYQDDHGGSSAQFLPVVGTFLANPGNPPLPRNLFIGKPGWDRYSGRLLQGTAIVDHRFNDNLRLSLKARYIDSDLDYFTHYPDSYGNPSDPYLPGSNGRLIGLISDGSRAGMNVFSTDNNVQVTFNTGPAIEHKLLAGIDYAWSQVKKRGGSGYEIIDIYGIDYDALSDYRGGLPPDGAYSTLEKQKQLGFYLQDQLRLWDRVSVVLGIRRDHVTAEATGADDLDTKATTFRAGIIGEIGANFSPFFSFTQSFLPITGTTADGSPFKPQRGRQFELGVKWQPDPRTLVTVTGFHIKETNRPVQDPANPLDQIQAGEETIKGFEVEAMRSLPGNFDLIVNYGYNHIAVKDTPSFNYLPEHNASIWATKTFPMNDRVRLRLGAGVRYTSKSVSQGFGGVDAAGNAFDWTIVTPSYTLVDALAAVSWDRWTASVNATNLLGERFFASCLARGDCFVGADRNVMVRLNYAF